MIRQRITLFLLILVHLLCFAMPVSSDELPKTEEGKMEEVSPPGSTSGKSNESEGRNDSVGQYLYEFTGAIASGATIGTVDALEELLEHSSTLAEDLQLIATKLQENRTGDMSPAATFILLLGIFPAALGLEKLTRYLFTHRFMGNVKGRTKIGPRGFAVSLLAFGRELIAILIFGLYCIALFNLIHGDDATVIVRAIFLSALFSLVLGRFTAGVIAAYLESQPGLTSPGRKRLQNGFMFVVWASCLMLFTRVSFQHLTLSPESLALYTIGSSTLIQLIILIVLLYYRKNIRSFLELHYECDKRNDSFFCKISVFWLLPVLVYLAGIWALQILLIYYQEGAGDSAYLLSLLAIPLYFVLVRIGCWIVKTIVETLNLYFPEKEDDAEICQRKEELLIAKACKYVHPVMFLGLTVWVLKKWGYELPFISDRSGAVFSITLSIGVTFLAWHLITGMIEKKLKNNEKVSPAADDEWGAENAQGREHTLLPVLKKCLATILALIALLTCLASLGVNIVPMLAGAGVLGIAIGFGSQQMISDILSGFFFLMDDSFRVGEYIEAGDVKGRVEEITLRNVLLRHHRGMLQIVPFSQLGAITNYMRGGIIEKFNLEFPYDTDVDKVRKIIKMVGLEMLEDEEYGEDFIRPLKSQGVREISNSVMVIRAKFTAKPGKHFVIRREAFRRVTQALNAKGVFYAHRKVIVDIPDAAADMGKVIETAGAAAQEIEQDHQLNGQAHS